MFLRKLTACKQAQSWISENLLGIRSEFLQMTTDTSYLAAATSVIPELYQFVATASVSFSFPHINTTLPRACDSPSQKQGLNPPRRNRPRRLRNLHHRSPLVHPAAQRRTQFLRRRRPEGREPFGEECALQCDGESDNDAQCEFEWKRDADYNYSGCDVGGWSDPEWPWGGAAGGDGTGG
jgi:hypothetical protein